MKHAIVWFVSVLCLYLSACTYETIEETPLCQEELVLKIEAVQHSRCGLAQGKVEVILKNTSADAQNVQFSIDGSSFQQKGIFENLPAGTYTIIAKDDVCESEIQAVVENQEGLNASATTTPSSCDVASGSITVNVSGANGKTVYALDGGIPQSSPTFTNLAAGSYQVDVMDDSGCNITLEAEVQSDVQYAAIDQIISSSCALSGCHGGNISPNFSSKSTIIEKADRIMARTSNQTMPPASSGISLTAAQIAAIQCWVESGAPE